MFVPSEGSFPLMTRRSQVQFAYSVAQLWIADVDFVIFEQFSFMS